MVTSSYTRKGKYSRGDKKQQTLCLTGTRGVLQGYLHVMYRCSVNKAMPPPAFYFCPIHLQNVFLDFQHSEILFKKFNFFRLEDIQI